jgi:hypothetical protein
MPGVDALQKRLAQARLECCDGRSLRDLIEAPL